MAKAVAVPAAPPTRIEIERKLSMRSCSTGDRPRPKRQSSTNANAASTSYGTGTISGNESDSSLQSSSHPHSHSATSPIIGSFPSSLPTPGLLNPIRERGNESAVIGMSDEDLGEEEGEGEEDSEGEGEGGVGVRAGGEELKRDMEGERLIKSGYLLKKGEKRKNWKKRWFVLRTEKLAYYRDEREYMLCRILSLREIHSVVSVQLKKHSYAFGIVTAKRTFYVRGNNQAEVDAWIGALNEAKRALVEGEMRTRNTAQVQAQGQVGGEGVEGGMGQGQGYGQEMDGQAGSSAAGTPSVPIPQAYTSTPPSGLDEQMNRLGIRRPSAEMNPIATSDRSRAPLPRGNSTPARREPSTSSMSSVPLDGNVSSSQLQGQAVGQTSSDEDDDAFLPQAQTFIPQSSSLAPGMGMPKSLQSQTEAVMTPGAAELQLQIHPQAAGQGQGISPIQTDPKKVVLNGYLMKLGSQRKTWRKRWFVLTSADLVYTKSHMDTKVHRQIPLSNIIDAIEDDSLSDHHHSSDSESAQITARSPTSPRKPRHTQHREKARPKGTVSAEHCFQVITAKRTFKLCAPSEEEEIKWLAALRALLNRERGMMSPNAAMGMSLPVLQGQGQGQAGGSTLAPPLLPTPSATQTIPQTPSVLVEEPSYFPSQPQPQTQQQHHQPSHPPPPPSASANQSGPRPGHSRNRSATQNAKAAVAEVVRRFNPDRDHSGNVSTH